MLLGKTHEERVAEKKLAPVTTREEKLLPLLTR
jgi:hypothetical protein